MVMVIVKLLQQVLTWVMSPFRPHHYGAVENGKGIHLNLNVRQFNTCMLYLSLAAALVLWPLLICAVTYSELQYFLMLFLSLLLIELQSQRLCKKAVLLVNAMHG